MSARYDRVVKLRCIGKEVRLRIGWLAVLGLLVTIFSSADAEPRRLGSSGSARKAPTRKVPAFKVKTRRVPSARLVVGRIDPGLAQKLGFMAQNQRLGWERNVSAPYEEGEEGEALRPIGYGRTLVHPGHGMEVKGAGGRDPQPTDYKSGLVSLPEVLREYAWHEVLRRVVVVDARRDVMAHHKWDVLPAHGVLSWGFHKYWPAYEPAGALIRPIHKRYTVSGNVQNRMRTLAIESALRRYGFSSSGSYQDHEHSRGFDLINLQESSRGELLDFGAFRTLTAAEIQGQEFRPWSMIYPDSANMHQIPGSPNDWASGPKADRNLSDLMDQLFSELGEYAHHDADHRQVQPLIDRKVEMMKQRLRSLRSN